MQILAKEGLKVRPLTLLSAEIVKERHDSPLDPGVRGVSDTGIHCIGASSVNVSVPF